MPRVLAILSALLFAAAVGCSPLTTRKPRLDSPGNTATQRFDAIYHDPYPLDDLGPEVVGGRPLGFQKPAPSVIRGRLLRGRQTSIPAGPVTIVPQF